MTKQAILEYFKDINAAYNNCNMLDSLSGMIDELLKDRQQVVRCKDCTRRNTYDCAFHIGGGQPCEKDTEDEFFCGDGELKEVERMSKIEEVIKKIQEEDPVNHSPFEYGEWYDGWADAIKYVVSVLEEVKRGDGE